MFPYLLSSVLIICIFSFIVLWRRSAFPVLLVVILICSPSLFRQAFKELLINAESLFTLIFVVSHVIKYNTTICFYKGCKFLEYLNTGKILFIVNSIDVVFVFGVISKISFVGLCSVFAILLISQSLMKFWIQFLFLTSFFTKFPCQGVIISCVE